MTTKVASRLLGAAPIPTGTGRNIAARTHASTPLSQITITADELVVKDTDGNALLLSSVAVHPAITASGANGLDTGAEAATTWYYGWVIAKEDGTVAGLLSTSATAPTMPSGYTYKALVTAVYNGATDFLAYRQAGSKVYFNSHQTGLGNGSASVETAVSLTTLVPPIALTFYTSLSIFLSSGGGAGSQASVSFRAVSGAESARVIAFAAAGQSGFDSIACEFPNVSQNLYYANSVAGAGATGGTDILVRGFKLPGGGE
jgi:hypothetical protein